MADDDVTRTHSQRTLRWIAALAALLAAAVAGVIAYRRRRPVGLPRTVAPAPPPAPVASVPAAAAGRAEPLGGSETVTPPAADGVEGPAAGLDALTVVDLRARARELGVTGYSKLRKADLVAAVRERDATNLAD